MNHEARIDEARSTARAAAARANEAWNAYEAACEACAEDDAIIRVWDALVIASRAATAAWNDLAQRAREARDA